MNTKLFPVLATVFGFSTAIQTGAFAGDPKPHSSNIICEHQFEGSDQPSLVMSIVPSLKTSETGDNKFRVIVREISPYTSQVLSYWSPIQMTNWSPHEGALALTLNDRHENAPTIREILISTRPVSKPPTRSQEQSEKVDQTDSLEGTFFYGNRENKKEYKILCRPFFL